MPDNIKWILILAVLTVIIFGIRFIVGAAVYSKNVKKERTKSAMKKRILTIALALVMCLSLFPMSAFAAIPPGCPEDGQGMDSIWGYEHMDFARDVTAYAVENGWSGRASQPQGWSNYEKFPGSISIRNHTNIEEGQWWQLHFNLLDDTFSAILKLYYSPGSSAGTVIWEEAVGSGELTMPDFEKVIDFGTQKINNLTLTAPTIDEISIKVPGCDASFSLENVSQEYGIVKGDVPEYIFAFPGENGKVTCDTEAVVDLYGEFHGKTPADSNAGGGDPVMEGGWSYSYNFVGEDGEGITLISVFAMEDGSLDTNYAENFSIKLTFVMGYPIEYGYYKTQLPDNLIKAEAELHSILALEVDKPTPDAPSSWATAEVESAISANLVPENLRQNYTQPVARSNVAQMFINLIEQSSGQTIDAFLAVNGVSINPNAFTDTSDYAVLAANALGIINGVGENRFDPDGTFTRAQIAAIINRVARVLGVKTEGFAHDFVDVAGPWVKSELGWPVHAGVINGVGDNRFDPDGQLTTEQAIAITYRSLRSFADN